MIRLVTDSASMIPLELRDRFDVDVVPMTVALDDHEFIEGVDITTTEFYERLAAGASVSTSAPSPGSFAVAYRRAADAGAERVVSIHTGSAYSATVASAEVAAPTAPIPVTVVDTGLASFPVTLCTWAAGEVLARGGDASGASTAANAVAARTGSVFVVGVPELARRGGRFEAVSGELVATSVLELGADGLAELDRVDHIDRAVEVMLAHVAELSAGTTLRAGVGDALRPELAEALVDGLGEMPGVVEVVRYEVGPSVGAHTGAGTVGIVYAPLDPS